MNEPAVIQATFADWRPVKGRKQLQLIFEVPLEETAIVLKMLGAPMPDKETWCAIALLEKPVSSSKVTAKTSRAFCDLPFPQQAGIKSSDLTFTLWMSTKLDNKIPEYEPIADNCAQAIREYCGVISRADILPGTLAGERWIELLREFEGVR